MNFDYHKGPKDTKKDSEKPLINADERQLGERQIENYRNCSL